VSLKKYKKGCVSLKKYKSEDKVVELTVNSKEENFCLDFVQEFGLWIGSSCMAYGRRPET
jgi:hypothetical protein